MGICLLNTAMQHHKATLPPLQSPAIAGRLGFAVYVRTVMHMQAAIHTGSAMLGKADVRKGHSGGDAGLD
jgi:hypothetical protein